MTGLMVDLEADDEDCLEVILSRTGVSLVDVLSRSSSAKREVGGEVLEEKRLDKGERVDPYVSKDVSKEVSRSDASDTRFELRVDSRGLGSNASDLVGIVEA